MKRNSRGFTLIELLVVIAIIALLMGLLLPALAKALGNARVRKDQGQLKGTVSSYSIYAESDDRKQYPLPGKINRLRVDITGGPGYAGITSGQVQGIGDHDDTINNSNWLHSYMIGAGFTAQRFLSVQVNKTQWSVQKVTKEQIPKKNLTIFHRFPLQKIPIGTQSFPQTFLAKVRQLRPKNFLAKRA